MKYQELFTPVKVGSITIKNRFAMAPMGPLGLADANGGWNQRGIDYYVERAKGGNIIGDLELDETLTSRETINSKMRTILDIATDEWGSAATSSITRRLRKRARVLPSN